MPQRPKTRESDFSQRVITALTDLADLSLRASTLRFAPPDALDQLATLLIQRLVTLCDAQQGALFLARPANEESVTSLQGAFANQPVFSLVALAQMSEEEARTLFATYPLVAAPPHWSIDLPPTLVWRRSLPAPDAQDAHLPHPSLPVNQLASPSYALLLFVWPEMPPQTQESSFSERDQAMRLLPLLANTVDTILLHLLAALGESEHPGELLPAEVLATVGHEFRGPLTTISGYATTLLRHDQQLLPEECQDFLGAISEASTHLGTLVDRFLGLAQLETGTAVFTPAAVDLVALAHEAITAARQRRPHARILPPSTTQMAEGQGEAAHTDELTVSGDRRWLRTMLDVLLENALAYSEPACLIEVRIEPIDPARLHSTFGSLPGSDTHMALILPGAFGEHEASLEIRVRDHGRGIPPEHVSRIFQRFYRVDTRLTRENNGLGLGLALCKAIVAHHRGMLWVESTLEEGSTFHIVLPCEAAAPGEILR